MKKLVFISIFVFFVCSTFAQQKINVQNGTKAEFYDGLEEAIEKAVSGDTIYLPGQIVQVQNDVIIDKKLAIIGAGWELDSIGGLQATEIKKGNEFATINFRNGSDGSLLTGCAVRIIQFGHKDESSVEQQNIKNVAIWRNRITGYIALGISSTNNQVKQIIISENAIMGSYDYTYVMTYLYHHYLSIYACDASDCIINNNLIYASVGFLQKSRICNNVIYNYFTNLQECIVENNFSNNNYGAVDNCSNSSFNNNAFRSDFTFPIGSNNGNNNLMSQATNSTFQNNLDWPKNLKIRDDSPCKNAGTDGTDIGIFGGPAPYKAGAVPFNPHINKALISSQTDRDGKLQINITVSAQDR